MHLCPECFQDCDCFNGFLACDCDWFNGFLACTHCREPEPEPQEDD